MHRFFIEGLLSAEIRITGQDAIHIQRVLRLQSGDFVVVVDPKGATGLAQIKKLEDKNILLSLQETLAEERESPVRVYLAQGLPKSDKMDLIVQKAVELGASAVIPLETAQCVVQYEAGKKKAKQERWQKIAMEAAKQSKRSHIPQVKEIQSLSDCLSSMPEDVYKIMLYEGRNPQGIKQILQRQRAKEVLLLVGPEGGFSASEVELCQRHGVHVVSMGPRILRTETAGLAGIAIVMYEYGDLGG